MTDCPCGTNEPFEACCGRYIDGETPAPTALALMRSRYSAFALGRGAYLSATLSSNQRADFNIKEFEATAANTKWQGLDIRATSEGGEKDENGTVEFVARYREGGQSIAHHEMAMFGREDGNWVFADCILNPKGPTVTAEKVGRNEPCTCGSGKKYKKCCGKAA